MSLSLGMKIAVGQGASANPGSPTGTVTSAAVAANGTTVTVGFSTAMTGSAGFTLDNGSTVTLTYASGSGTSTFTFTAGSTIALGDTPTLDYTAGNFQDAAAHSLATVVDFPVTNHSTQDIPADITLLTNRLVTSRPLLDVAASHVWQDDLRTSLVTAAGQVVRSIRIASTPAYLTESGADRLEYGVDSDGIGYFESIGNPAEGSLQNATILATIGTGPFHVGVWVYMPTGTVSTNIFAAGADTNTGVTTAGQAQSGYEGQALNATDGAVLNDFWELVQLDFDGVTTTTLTVANDVQVTNSGVEARNLGHEFEFFYYSAALGFRIGTSFFRNAAASPADRLLAYNAGPNGDGSHWPLLPPPPPPIAITASVPFSGGLVYVDTEEDFEIGAGTPTVTVDGGDPIDCPRYYAMSARRLCIRIPTADVIPDDSAVVTVTIPDGLLDIGAVADAEVTNGAGVETLPTEPDADAYLMEVGVNSYADTYYTSTLAFGDVFKKLGPFQNLGATVTFDSDGLPTSITGGTGYIRAFCGLAGGGALWPTGSYLLRWAGAGTVEIREAQFGNLYTVASTGTAGGYNYAVITVDQQVGFEVRITSPFTERPEFWMPGCWDAGTHLPNTLMHPDWLAAYDGLTSFRLMGYHGVNGSNVRLAADWLPETYYTSGETYIRTASATITAASLSTSDYLGAADAGASIWLCTHAAGDVFQTGDFMDVIGEAWEVERIDSTHFKARVSANPNGTVATLAVLTYGIVEDATAGFADDMGMDLWLCIPHLMPDSEIRTVLQRYLATLPVGKKMRIEYSNEAWNQFRGYFHLAGLARVRSTSQVEEYARRSAEIHKVAREEFDDVGRLADLITVAAWQAAGSTGGRTMLDAYAAWCDGQSYDFRTPDEYAIAPYINWFGSPGTGSDAGSKQFRDFIAGGSSSPDFLSAAQINDLLEYGMGDTGGFITSSSAMVDDFNSDETATVAKSSYEAGQSIFGARNGFSARASFDGSNYSGSDGTDGAGLLADLAYQRANRHPRIGLLHTKLMQLCKDAGHRLFGLFTCDDKWGQDGYWGVRVKVDQVVGPGDGSGAGNDNRDDLDDDTTSEAPKLYWCREWARVAAPSTNGLRTGLAHYYKFDEASGNLLDAAGSTNGVENDTPGTTTGALGTCRTFNGSSWYFSFTGNFGGGAATGSPHSWSLWLNSSSLAGNHQALGWYSGTKLFQIGTTGANVQVVYGVSPFDAIQATTITTSTWHHVVFTFSAAGVGKLYLDGSLAGTDSSVTGAFDAATDLNIGRRGGDGTEYWNGSLDEIGYYTRELSAGDVTLLYGSGTPPAFSTFDGTP